MSRKTSLAVALLAALLLTTSALGDDDGPGSQWRSVGSKASKSSSSSSTREPSGITFPEQPRLARRISPSEPTGVRLASAELPSDQGQVWREYDISNYTLRVTSTKRPEQAIVDWILRETGYEAWHSETISILSATARKLRVYHTPEMQQIVRRIVDRFVGSQADSQAFSLRVASVNNPNWRAKMHGYLQPVKVQTPGVQAWVLRKENAAVLLAELNRRTGYREYSSPYLMIHNGQSSIVNLMRPKLYVRDVIRPVGAIGGFQAEGGQIDEGMALEFCPLLSLDTKSIDATIKCTVTHVDKMLPVVLDVPMATTSQRTKIEVPQMSHFRFHERFRWPTDQVLLISMGMVARPTTTGTAPLTASLPLALGGNSGRADLLVLVEAKPTQDRTARRTNSNLREARKYRGRY